ncbi:MAG: GMC oxidoreductase [Pirellulales bacterium]
MPSDPTERPQDVIWDAIVVGTGMGGGTLGAALAQAGWRVLFVERGRSSLDPSDDSIRNDLPDDRPDVTRLPEREYVELLARGGRSTDLVEDISGQKPPTFTPFIGAGTGGSTALYGMALERLFAGDFEPRADHPTVDGANLPERWPIDYETLRPWYVAAERLYRVHGTPDPLRPGDTDCQLLESPRLTKTNAELFAHLQSRGLHPYQLHLGCEHLDDCQTCQGYLCARDCKSDSGNRCLRPAIEQHGASLLTNCTATRLEAEGSSVRRVVCRRGDEEIVLRGRYVILAAGALVTPVLLLNSHSVEHPQGLANSSDQVGRNLMRHCIDLLMVQMNAKEPVRGQIKELAFNDFYHLEGQKLGTFQSFGPLPPIAYFLNQESAWWLKVIKPLLVWLGEQLRAKGLVVTTIMEDLPYAEHRVLPSLTPFDGLRQRIRLNYNLQPYELQRLEMLRKAVENVLKPYKIVQLRGAKENRAIAHVCGTCRFGDDPRTSVLDRDCRAHEVDNLYVVDASFFPSSGGINPSLTIAANALRVAAHLVDRGR